MKNAYYKLLRELCINTELDQAQLAFLLRTLKLPSEDLVPIWTKIKEGKDAMRELDVEETTKEMAKVFHQNTWFSMHQSARIARTLRGTRPGDSWADLLFNYVATQLLSDLEQEAKEAGIECSLLWNGGKGHEANGEPTQEASVFVSVWADDLAFMLWHEKPQELLEALSALTELTVKHLANRGLEVNLGHGKTEAVVHLRGPSSTRLRRQTFSQADPHIVYGEESAQGKLRVVIQYVHLGGLLHSKGKMGPELRRRVAIAKAAFATHRVNVYQNPHLARKYRVRVFEACVLSTAFYNAGAWTGIKEQEWRSFENAILGLYKRLLIKEFDHEALHTWSMERLCHTLQLLSPTEMLRFARLRHYEQALRTGSPALWGLMAIESTWLHHTRGDLLWLHMLTVGRTNRPSPEKDPAFWDSLMLTQTGVWKGLLKKGKLRALQTARHRYSLHQWFKDCGPFLSEAGLAWEVTTPQSPADACYTCLPCKVSFQSKAAWAVHCFKKHNRKASARFLASGSTCDNCGRHYLSNARLVMHLQYSTRCARALRGRGIHVQPEPGLRSRPWRRAELDDRCPWQETAGPRLPETTQDRPTLTVEEGQLYDDLVNAFFDMLEEQNALTVEEIVERFCK